MRPRPDLGLVVWIAYAQRLSPRLVACPTALGVGKAARLDQSAAGTSGTLCSMSRLDGVAEETGVQDETGVSRRGLFHGAAGVAAGIVAARDALQPTNRPRPPWVMLPNLRR